jgi:hypothetical protein
MMGLPTPGAEDGEVLEKMLAEQKRFPSLRQEEKAVIAAAGGDSETQQEMENTLLEVEKYQASAPAEPAASVETQQGFRTNREDAQVLETGPATTMTQLEALIQKEKSVIASENRNIVEMQSMHPVLGQLSSIVTEDEGAEKQCKVPTVAMGWCNVNAKRVEFGQLFDSGSTCDTACEPGYDASTGSLLCSNGILVPSTFKCNAKTCKAPENIENVAEDGSCYEGTNVAFGTSCTATCLPGYTPTISKFSCDVDNSGEVNLNYQGERTFACEANLDKCAAPRVQHAAIGGSCAEGVYINDGDHCTTACSVNYLASQATLKCEKGVFSPSSFTCEVNSPKMMACSDADVATVDGFARKYSELYEGSTSTQLVDCAEIHADGKCEQLRKEGGKAMCGATCGFCSAVDGTPCVSPLDPGAVWTIDKATLMSLEAFPMLGALGVTRFYMGCWVTGALQGLSSAISLGIVGNIWAFVDFLLLEKNSFNDDCYIDVFGMHANFEQGKLPSGQRGHGEYSSIQSAQHISYVCIATWALYISVMCCVYYRFFRYYY